MKWIIDERWPERGFQFCYFWRNQNCEFFQMSSTNAPEPMIEGVIAVLIRRLR